MATRTRSPRTAPATISSSGCAWPSAERSPGGTAYPTFRKTPVSAGGLLMSEANRRSKVSPAAARMVAKFAKGPRRDVRLEARDPARADVRVVASPGGQVQPVAWVQERRCARIGQAEADRARIANQHFVVTVV